MEFGRGVLREFSQSWGDYLVVTMPEVWERAKKMVATPAHVCFVDSMDSATVERLERVLPRSETIVGVGGGMAMDMAKFVAWKRGLDPVLVPSIASVDACVTNTIAVRESGRVRYLGFSLSAAVISDFELMSSAPPRLNRAGIGDILSIHTGSFDWRLAAAAGEVEFDPKAASRVERLVNDLESKVYDIRQANDVGLQWLIEAYAAENAVCLAQGHSRPEEGSEHFFAYNCEAITGKKFIHGELVCLGVVLMARLQDNDPERVLSIIKDAGVRFHPRDLGLCREEVENTLATVAQYVKQEGLFHSIIDERELDVDMIGKITAGLEY